MTLQNDLLKEDSFEVIEVRFCDFLDQIEELKLEGKRVAAMIVDQKRGQYRLTVIRERKET